jgi:dihydrofolate reductase
VTQDLQASPYPLELVVAVATNGVIGNNNSLPWNLRSDLQRFKRITIGHVLLMGRKTFESIGRLLPGRRTIVLTRQHDYQPTPATLTASSIKQAMSFLVQGERPFVVGGAEIYRMAWPLAGKLHRTRVHAELEGDTRLDDWDLSGWRCVEQEYVPADDRNQWPSTYELWERNFNIL